MQLHHVFKGILPLLFLLGVFAITGLAEAVENEKSKEDFSEYDDDVSSVPETHSTQSPSESPYFEKTEISVHATQEGDNVTIACQPKNFNESRHEILWYHNNLLINTGNNIMVHGDYALDTKSKLIVFNYTKSIPYHFTCAVAPGDARQNITIVFHPPDNISEPSGAVKYDSYMTSYFQIAAMTIVLVLTANVWN